MLVLRRDDRCARCSAALVAGTRAYWDATTKVVVCLDCVATPSPVQLSAGASQPVTGDPMVVSSVDDPPGPAPMGVGTPGLSARKEFDRRRAKRESQVEAKWGTGRLGRLAKRLSDDPQSTKAWAAGADGEQRVAAILHEKLGDRAVLLHDRKVARTRGNIDQLAIAASGVWIIDAKRDTGKVERRDVGGLLRTDFRLYVGGRDRTKAVDGLGWQLDAVCIVLDDVSVPVHPSLGFVGADWPLLFKKPFQLRGV